MRNFRIFPLARFRKFHSFQLVRAVFNVLLERFLSGSEDPADLAFAPDAAASFLVDKFTLRTYAKKEFAKDILRWVSFIPTIDRILYAPQIPFATAYLGENDPTTRRLMEEILAKEEEHADDLANLLEDLGRH